MTDVDILVFKTVLSIIAAGGGYAILLRRLADFAQPHRVALAELGERVLSSNATQDRKSQASFYLENAFSGWVVVFATVALPFVAVVSMVSDLLGRRSRDIQTTEEKNLAILFSLSVICANPIVGLILALEFFVVSLVLIVISGQEAITKAMMTLARAESALPTYGTRWSALAG